MRTNTNKVAIFLICTALAVGSAFGMEKHEIKVTNLLPGYITLEYWDCALEGTLIVPKEIRLLSRTYYIFNIVYLDKDKKYRLSFLLPYSLETKAVSLNLEEDQNNIFVELEDINNTYDVVIKSEKKELFRTILQDICFFDSYDRNFLRRVTSNLSDEAPIPKIAFKLTKSEFEIKHNYFDVNSLKDFIENINIIRPAIKEEFKVMLYRNFISQHTAQEFIEELINILIAFKKQSA